jgi:hypothetical protein
LTNGAFFVIKYVLFKGDFMRQTKITGLLRISGFLLLVLATSFYLAACRGKDQPRPASQEKAPRAEEISLDTVAEVLGKAEAEKSGIFDLVPGEKELTVLYHFYTPEQKDIDDDIGRDIAPKIKALFKKFNSLDRVVFDIRVMRSGLDTDWTPYCSFVLTRKTFNETNWADLLDSDFFKVVEALTYAK